MWMEELIIATKARYGVNVWPWAETLASHTPITIFDSVRKCVSVAETEGTAGLNRLWEAAGITRLPG